MTVVRAFDGQAAEALAARYLERRGVRVLERNYRCRAGEIDLIGEDRESLVFFEVRLRRSQRFGGAAASVNAPKQARILRAARHYLAGRAERPCRFDVLVLDELDAERIEWLRDAFGE